MFNSLLYEYSLCECCCKASLPKITEQIKWSPKPNIKRGNSVYSKIWPLFHIPFSPRALNSFGWSAAAAPTNACSTIHTWQHKWHAWEHTQQIAISSSLLPVGLLFWVADCRVTRARLWLNICCRHGHRSVFHSSDVLRPFTWLGHEIDWRWRQLMLFQTSGTQLINIAYWNYCLWSIAQWLQKANIAFQRVHWLGIAGAEGKIEPVSGDSIGSVYVQRRREIFVADTNGHAPKPQFLFSVWTIELKTLKRYSG